MDQASFEDEEEDEEEKEDEEEDEHENDLSTKVGSGSMKISYPFRLG